MLAAKLMDRADSAMTAAASVHIHGWLMDGRGPYPQLDLSVDRKGHASGYLIWAETRLDLLRVGKSYYIKGNAPFWQRRGRELYANRWLKSAYPNSRSGADMLSWASMRSVTALLWPVGKQSTFTRVGPVPVHGSLAVGVRGRTPANNRQTTYLTMHSDGSLLPAMVRWGGHPGLPMYVQWNETVAVKAPTSFQTVDLRWAKL
jgi:hypothetical protein